MEDRSPITEGQTQTDATNTKRKKMWRNIFILNLCLTFLLIGIFWLPVKFAQLNTTLNKSSVKVPVKGEATPMTSPEDDPSHASNLLPTQHVMVNATDEEKWAYFDFSRGKQINIHDSSSLEWDLAFRRGKVITNGGASNKIGKAGLVDLGEVEFNTVDSVPDKEFKQDVSTRTDTENPVLSQWYKYNYITHKLTARKNVYIFRTADSKFAKIKFLSFYCADSKPGCIQLQYAYQGDGSKKFTKEAATIADLSSAEEPSGT